MPWVKRPDVAALVLLLAVVAGIPVITNARGDGSHGGTRLSSGHPIAAILVPIRAWHFLPAVGQSHVVLLSLSNHNAHPVEVEILSESRVVHRVSVPPASGTEIELASRYAARVITVRATGAIVPERLTMRGSTVRSSYGLPGASTSGP